MGRPHTGQCTCGEVRRFTCTNGEVEPGDSTLVGGAQHEPNVHFAERRSGTGNIGTREYVRRHIQEGSAAVRVQQQWRLPVPVRAEHRRGAAGNHALQRLGQPGQAKACLVCPHGRCRQRAPTLWRPRIAWRRRRGLRQRRGRRAHGRRKDDVLDRGRRPYGRNESRRWRGHGQSPGRGGCRTVKRHRRWRHLLQAGGRRRLSLTSKLRAQRI